MCIRDRTYADGILPLLYHWSTYGNKQNGTSHSKRISLGKYEQRYSWFRKKCKMCALSKPARKSQISQLISETPTTPFSNIYLDFSGPYPRSKSGNTMLLICEGSFNKFVWMYPMPVSYTHLDVYKRQLIGGDYGDH